MRQRWLRSVVVALLSVFVGAACGGTASSNAPAKSVGSIVVGVGIDASFGSLVAAVDEGFFKKNGVDATLKVYQSGLESFQAVATGQADVTTNGQFTVPTAAAKGANAKIVADVETSGKQFGIVSKTSITSPQDLEGKTVGFQQDTTPEYYYYLYIQKYHLQNVKAKHIALTQLVAALAAGDIDAYFAFEPWLTRGAETVPATHVLARSGDDNVMPLRIYMSYSQKLYQNKQLGDAVMKSVVEAGDWCNSHHDQLAKDLAAAYHQPLADNQRYVAYFDYTVTFNKADLAEIQRVTDFLVTQKQLQRPDLSKFVTTDFVKDVAPKRIE